MKQKGFTLVELVVVIVILGILAATALPRFVNLTNDARRAALNGLAGGLRSAVAVVQARYIANGTGTSPVTMADSTTVAVGTSGAAAGIPTATGILSALQSYDGFTPSGTGPVVFNFSSGTLAGCNVSYDPTTGAVTVTTSGSSCN